MVSFFKENSAAAIFGLVIVSAGTRTFFWVHPPQIVTALGDGLIYYLLSNLSMVSGILLPLMYHFIVVIQALRINYAFNDVRMFPKPAFTTALAYIILTALIPAWNNISSALIVNSMLIWLIYRIIKLYNTHQPGTLIYNIGLITGCTVLLYFAAIPLILVAFFSIGSFRPFRANEWVILLIGIITPFYFMAGWLFLNDKWDTALQQVHIFHPHIVYSNNILLMILTFGIAGVAIIAGMYMWQFNSGRMTVQVRYTWNVLFVMFLLFLPTVFFINNAWPNALLLATVPAAAFVSNTFLYPKRNLYPAIVFWIFVGLVIYNNWFVAKN